MKKIVIGLTILTACQSNPEKDSELETAAEPSIEPADEASDEPASEPSDPPAVPSTAIKTQTWSPTYDRSVTAGNPLKGFLSSPLWGTPEQDLPHSLEFVYLPLKDILPSEGVYAFDTGLEPHLEAAKARGNHLIVRFYMDYPSLDAGAPQWLLDEAGCFFYTDHGGGCSPNYNSPTLQTTLLDFIAEWGALYDGDPRLGFIQIGLIGYWGEWHTWPNGDQFATDAFQQELISAFDLAFDQTRLLLRYPSQDSPNRDIGFHDDSFAHSTLGEIPWFFANQLVSAEADDQWQIAPIGGELRPELQENLFTADYQLGEYSQDPMECIEQTHASWMLNYKAFHKNGVGYQGDQLTAANEAAMAMGYEFSMDEITLMATGLYEGTVDLSIAVTISATGVAPFYYPIHLSIEMGSHSATIDNDLQTLLPGENRELSLYLEDVPASEITQSIQMQLTSTILMPGQSIVFAAENNDGQVTYLPVFGCIGEDSVVTVGQEVDGCLCDVDGMFRTPQGEDCPN